MAEAADLLDGSGRFVPAADQADSDVGSPWSVRDALLEAAGCDRRLGPLAYEERTELQDAIGMCFTALDEQVDGDDAETWVNASKRSEAEVVAALRDAPGDVDFDRDLHLHPWVERSKIRTARFPYLALAVLFHAWAQKPDQPLQKVLSRYKLTADTDPWTLFDRVLPTVQGTPVPDLAVETASAMRDWMMDRKPLPAIYSPCMFLTAADTAKPITSLEDLLTRAKDREPVTVQPIDVMA